MCEGLQRGAPPSEQEPRKRRRLGQFAFDRMAMGWESRSNCRISATLSCARDIAAHLEHAFSGRQGEWRASFVGSRAAESWDWRVEGPNGFERSYTLSAAAGEHELSAIWMLVLRLVPPAKP